MSQAMATAGAVALVIGGAVLGGGAQAVAACARERPPLVCHGGHAVTCPFAQAAD